MEATGYVRTLVLAGLLLLNGATVRGAEKEALVAALIAVINSKTLVQALNEHENTISSCIERMDQDPFEFAYSVSTTKSKRKELGDYREKEHQTKALLLTALVSCKTRKPRRTTLLVDQHKEGARLLCELIACHKLEGWIADLKEYWDLETYLQSLAPVHEVQDESSLLNICFEAIVGSRSPAMELENYAAMIVNLIERRARLNNISAIVSALKDAPQAVKTQSDAMELLITLMAFGHERPTTVKTLDDSARILIRDIAARHTLEAWVTDCASFCNLYDLLCPPSSFCPISPTSPTLYTDSDDETVSLSPSNLDISLHG